MHISSNPQCNFIFHMKGISSDLQKCLKWFICSQATRHMHMDMWYKYIQTYIDNVSCSTCLKILTGWHNHFMQRRLSLLSNMINSFFNNVPKMSSWVPVLLMIMLNVAVFVEGKLSWIMYHTICNSTTNFEQNMCICMKK